MKLLRVLYYYNQLFVEHVAFSKSNRDGRALFCLGFTFIIPTCAIIDSVAQYKDFPFNRGIFVLLTILVFAFLYFALVHNGKAQKNYDNKPQLFNNRSLSLTISVLTVVLALAIILLATIYLDGSKT